VGPMPEPSTGQRGSEASADALLIDALGIADTDAALAELRRLTQRELDTRRFRALVATLSDLAWFRMLSPEHCRQAFTEAYCLAAAPAGGVVFLDFLRQWRGIAHMDEKWRRLREWRERSAGV
jgi:hypothetical protein